jgi:hypothetical protein
MHRTRRKPQTSGLIRSIHSVVFAAVICVPLVFSAGAFAQNAFDKGTPAESKGGLSSLSTYARDKVETVNLANGNLNVSIPLVTVGGRGTATFTVSLNYNSKVWSGQHDAEVQQDIEGIPAGKIDHYTGTFDDGVARTPNVIKLGAGWQISKGPAIKINQIHIDPLPRSLPNNRGNRIHVRPH